MVYWQAHDVKRLRQTHPSCCRIQFSASMATRVAMAASYESRWLNILLFAFPSLMSWFMFPAKNNHKFAISSLTAMSNAVRWANKFVQLCWLLIYGRGFKNKLFSSPRDISQVKITYFFWEARPAMNHFTAFETNRMSRCDIESRLKIGICRCVRNKLWWRKLV